MKDLKKADFAETAIEFGKYVQQQWARHEIADYCIERKNNIDAETFYDFYESKDWKIGKNKMKSWKACIRTWEKRQTNNKSKGISKIHLHLQKNMNVKQKLKQQLNNDIN